MPIADRSETAAVPVFRARGLTRVYRMGEVEVQALRGVDLDRSFAYADSHSDLPMLETAGNAVAVSPDIPLMRAARRNQWSVVEWKIKPIMPRWALPT